MKKFLVLLIALLFMQSADAKAEITFKIVSPVDTVKNAGDFVLDAGKKVCEGVITTGLGIGEVVTAPFRADYKKPKARIYKYQPPRLDWFYTPSRLYKEDSDLKNNFKRKKPEVPKTQAIPQPLYRYSIKHIAKK
jgi:hypothetical protein